MLDTCVIAGVIGGQLGYHLLRQVAGVPRDNGRCTGSAYEDRSKLEALFGPGVWPAIEGRTVIDFGCGSGLEAVEMARRGAKRVIGIDIRETVLGSARRLATLAGVSDRCVFDTDTDDKADVILSIDGFEHYGDPEGILRRMRRLINPDGHVLIAFGPPWLHPLGGHLFSVFPWAHLVFTERALIRWRADFKFDGATRFCETEGGLNRMTVRRFLQLVRDSDFALTAFDAVPIRRLARLSSPLTREFVTSVVKCRLVPGGRQARTEEFAMAAPFMRSPLGIIDLARGVDAEGPERARDGPCSPRRSRDSCCCRPEAPWNGPGSIRTGTDTCQRSSSSNGRAGHGQRRAGGSRDGTTTGFAGSSRRRRA